mgnify:CR=1 FL=1
MLDVDRTNEQVAPQEHARDRQRTIVTTTPERIAAESAQIPSQYVDTDPLETIEWSESLAAVIEHAGPARARYLILELLKAAAQRGLDIPRIRSTDYINKIGRAHV